MNILIDFDWTLYDIAALREDAESASLMEHWLTGLLWDYFDPADYFYPDALPWLVAQREAGASIQLISIHHGPDWGAPAESFQRRKIAGSGVAEYVDSITIVSGQKADHIGPLLITDDINLFIDDLPEEVTSVAARYEEVQCVRMARPGSKYVELPTPAGVPEITQLADFDPMVYTV